MSFLFVCKLFANIVRRYIFRQCGYRVHQLSIRILVHLYIVNNTYIILARCLFLLPAVVWVILFHSFYLLSTTVVYKLFKKRLIPRSLWIIRTNWPWHFLPLHTFSKRFTCSQIHPMYQILFIIWVLFALVYLPCLKRINVIDDS